MQGWVSGALWPRQGLQRIGGGGSQAVSFSPLEGSPSPPLLSLHERRVCMPLCGDRVPWDPPPHLLESPERGIGELPTRPPPVQWRPAFLDLLVGNLQPRKASVSRICWPLNLAGEAQVASGREVLASSHLERQRVIGIGREMAGCVCVGGGGWGVGNEPRGQDPLISSIAQKSHIHFTNS